MILHEMSALVLAPIVLLGSVYASEVTTQVHKDSQAKIGHGAIAQLLTGDEGWGAGLKASTVGLYAIDAHYGFKGNYGPWALSLMPRAGVSYTSQTVRELPQDVQFSVGAQLLVSYEAIVLSSELWHLSNAGVTPPNTGINMVAITAGWRF